MNLLVAKTKELADGMIEALGLNDHHIHWETAAFGGPTYGRQFDRIVIMHYPTHSEAELHAQLEYAKILQTRLTPGSRHIWAYYPGALTGLVSERSPHPVV